MKPIKSKLAVAALLSLSGLGVANADTIASAQLDISNFKWTAAGQNLTTGTNTPYQVIISPAGTNDGSMSVSLTGFATQTFETHPSIIPSGGQIPLTTLCIGPDCGSAPTGAPPVGTYSYSSEQLTGAVVDIPAAGIIAGATANQLAEVSLTGNAAGRSDTALGANTAFNFTFTGGNTGDVVATVLSLDYLSKAITEVISPFALTDDARAGVTWNLTINDITSGVVNVVNVNPSDLNITCATGAGESPCIISHLGSLAINANLISGNNYRFAITSALSAVGDRAVPAPEPGLMLMLALGLMGFGLQKRKNAKLIA